MLVSQYVEQVIASKPYKPNTRNGYVRAMKRLGVWDLEVSSLSAALIMDRVQSVGASSTKNTTLIACKALFKDINDCGTLKVKAPQLGKVYDLPTQEVLEWVINRSPYRLQLLLMMYAGLRLGEACAMTLKKLQGHEGNYWIVVDEAWDIEGKHLTTSKTAGKVMIPDWLAMEMKGAKPLEWWQKGQRPNKITSHLLKLSKTRIFRTISGNKSVNPHMLRHWFATDMVRRGVNPEIARRQMRHASPTTTLMIYTQIRSDEIKASLPNRPKLPTPSPIPEGNVIPLFQNPYAS